MHQATFANLVEPVNPIPTYLKTKALLMFTIYRNAIFCSPLLHISVCMYFFCKTFANLPASIMKICRGMRKTIVDLDKV